MNNGPTQNFGTYTRLVSGKYTITITDANQCPSLVVNTELIEPPKIVGSSTPPLSGESNVLAPGIVPVRLASWYQVVLIRKTIF